MSNKELRSAIIEKFKAKGYKQNTDYTISVKNAGYSTAVNVTIKKLELLESDFENVLKEFKSVDYCKRTGEILEGGNTYIRCGYDWQKMQDYKDSIKDEVFEIYNNAVAEGRDGKCREFVKEDNFRISFVIDSDVILITDRRNKPLYKGDGLVGVMAHYKLGHYAK